MENVGYKITKFILVPIQPQRNKKKIRIKLLFHPLAFDCNESTNTLSYTKTNSPPGLDQREKRLSLSSL